MKYEFDCGCAFDNIDYENIFYKPEYQYGQCPKVWEMLASGLTKGCFQLESQLGSVWSKKLKPENDEHLAALIALLRPGVLNAKDADGHSMAEHYALRKNGLEEIQYLHDALAPILNETYGIICFQENAIKIANQIAGFTLSEADTLRKAIGKKLAKLLFEQRQKFIDGCKKMDIVTEEQAIILWDNIEKSNRYAFNKSHAVEYGSYVLYWTAYTKAHCTLEFFASYLCYAKEKQDPHAEMKELIDEAKLFNIEVCLPSIFSPEEDFHINKDKIRFGLSNIRGIGASAVPKIIEAISTTEQLLGKNIHYWSWLDFLQYCSFNISSSIMKSLISSGALDGFKVSRLRMLYEYDKINQLNDKELEWMLENTKDCDNLEQKLQRAWPRKKRKKDPDDGIYGCTNTDKRSLLLKGLYTSLVNPPYQLEDSPEWVAVTEQHYLGVNISCSKIDGCDTSFANSTCLEVVNGRSGAIILGVEISRLKEHLTKTKKERMAFLSVTDSTANLDVVVFPDQFAEFEQLCFVGNTVMIHGEKKYNKPGVIVQKIIQI